MSIMVDSICALPVFQLCIMGRREYSAMLLCWLPLLVLYHTTPSSGSSLASFRALQNEGSRQSGCITSRSRRGPSRSPSCKLCGNSTGSSRRWCFLLGSRGGWLNINRDDHWKDWDEEGTRRLLTVLSLSRGGAAGRGYNYDDDYYEYKGPEEEEPYYYDDGGGQNGREWGGYDDDPYDDGRPAPRRGQGRRKSGGSVAGFDLTGTITRGNKKYGVYALLGSVLLTMLGVSLMFEKNLIRLGNVGFIAGVALFIGPSNVVRYFSQSSKLRGSIIFALGFFFVFTGHPMIGLAVEVFGFLNLYGNMLPMVWAMVANMPLARDFMGSNSAKKRNKSGQSRQGRSSRPAPARDYDQGYGYEEDEWDGDGGGWGYDKYDR